jgi:hypothetical protein
VPRMLLVMASSAGEARASQVLARPVGPRATGRADPAIRYAATGYRNREAVWSGDCDFFHNLPITCLWFRRQIVNRRFFTDDALPRLNRQFWSPRTTSVKIKLTTIVNRRRLICARNTGTGTFHSVYIQVRDAQTDSILTRACRRNSRYN